MKNKTYSFNKLLYRLTFTFLFGMPFFAFGQNAEPITVGINETFSVSCKKPDNAIIGYDICGGIGIVKQEIIGDTINFTLKSTGYPMGSFSINATEDHTEENGCHYSATTTLSHSDIYKKFPLPEGYILSGPDCLGLNQEYVFSVEDILSLPRTYNSCEYDDYIWSLPEGLELISTHPNGHSVKVKVNAFPSQPISCKVGLKNDSSATVFKFPRKKAHIPEIIQQPVACIPSDTMNQIIEVAKPDPDFNYEWELSNTDWGKKSFTTESTIGINVTIFTSSGQVRLRVFGECDTAVHIFTISRAIGGGGTEIVDAVSVEEGDSLYYSIYPSPNQHIVWGFPEGWQTDEENEYSSTVHVCPKRGEATSGKIVATTRLSECATSGDTLDVFIRTYPPAPIQVLGDDPNLECFSRNESYTFTSDTVRHGKMYVWTFPSGWDKTTDTIREWSGTKISTTVKPLAEASNDSIKLSVFGTLGERKDTSYYVKFTPKDIDGISLLTGCLNKGINTYNSIYTFQNPENGVTYTWLAPENWVKNDSMSNVSSSMLHLSRIEQNLEEANNTYSLSVSGENACGISNIHTSEIVHEGIVHYYRNEFTGEDQKFDPSLEYMDFFYNFEGLPDDDPNFGINNDSWYIYLSEPGELGKIEFRWTALMDGLEYSVDQYLFDPTYFRTYTEGEAFIGVEYRLASGEGCATKLGVNVVQGASNTAPFKLDNLKMKSQVRFEKLNISPNPAKNQVSIKVPVNVTATQFVIYDNKGQIAKTFNANSKEISIDVSDLTKGIYFMRTLDNPNVLTSKIIISH